MADLAGPGIGNYTELEKILPNDYHSLLDRRQTQKAIYAFKTYIEEHLCQELNLIMTSVPLIVDVDSGVNDYLDRDGSRTPIGFHISNDRDAHPIDAQVVQAATKWKRMALKAFDMKPGARASARTCVRCGRTISWITITACMSINGTGSAPSRLSNAISTS